MAGSGGGDLELEYTPTWIVAVICFVIVFISFLLERVLHFIGKVLKRKNQTKLFEALQKVKEELMLVGFISLLLMAFQGAILRICIPEYLTRIIIVPCHVPDEDGVDAGADASAIGVVGRRGRRLLATSDGVAHCASKGLVPLLSSEALHQMHIFIFILAIIHVVLIAMTMLIGEAKIRQWKQWEDMIQKEERGNTVNVPGRFVPVRQLEFIKKYYKGFSKESMILGWLNSFLKQIYGCVTKLDYTTMRLGFIMTHCSGNPKFNFYKYMVRILEADFKRVVSISWYLWIIVSAYILLNVHGWNTYFWISFAPLIVLLIVGAKLEHIIAQLAREVAEKHSAIEGELVVNPSDYHFWFDRPRIVLYMIQFILFQNAFEIAFFFWILAAYGFHSCIMGKVVFLIPRLVLSIVVQLLCSYSTLPLHAIVSQMGSSFNKAIFEEHVQEGLVTWAQKVKKRHRLMDEEGNTPRTPRTPRTPGFDNHSSVGSRLQEIIVENDPHIEEVSHEPVGDNARPSCEICGLDK